MAKVKNVKLVLADERDFEYESADVTIEQGGALTVVTEDVALYAPGAWLYVTHDKTKSTRQRAERVR